MPKKRVLLAIGALLSVALVAPALASDSSAPTSPYTALALQGSARGATHSVVALDPSNATITGTPAASGGGLAFEAAGTGEHWNVTLAPPTDAAWTVGTTYSIGYTSDPGQASFTITGNSYPCQLELTKITIKQADVNASGALTDFAADFTASCYPDPTGMTGQLRWKSNIGYAVATVDPIDLQFGGQNVDTTPPAQTATFTSLGSKPLVLGKAAVHTVASATFTITADTCSNATLSYGQSCSVQVTAAAHALGEQTATVDIPDNTPYGVQRTSADIWGIDPRSVTVTPLSLNFGGMDLHTNGQPQSITVHAGGTASLAIGKLSISGATGDFSITADACSQKTIAAGSTCQVTVTPHATIDMERDAVLHIPNNTVTGELAVPLTGQGEIGVAGMFYPGKSERMLDTRNGTGTPKKALTAGSTLKLKITGLIIANYPHTPPSGISAVVLNLTGTNTTASTYLTAYPDGSARPTASSLNLAAGQTRANMVTVKVGSDGYIDIYNHAGSVQVIADLLGYYAADDSVAGFNSQGWGDQYQPLTPARLLDTRDKSFGGPLGSGYEVAVPADFGSDFNRYVSALVVNITEVGATGSGWFSTEIGGGNASTLNFTKGSTVPNMAIVPTFECGSVFPGCGDVPAIGVINDSPGTVNVIVDVVGFMENVPDDNGSRFFPTSPTRITDTRTGLGASILHPASTATITTPAGVLSTPTSLLNPQVSGLDLNVTAVAPTASTYATVWAANLAQPTASNLNAAPGQTVANSVFTGMDSSGRFKIYNSAGMTNMIADVAGIFEIYPYGPSAQNVAAAKSLALRGTARKITVSPSVGAYVKRHP